MSELATTYDFYKDEFELWRKILSRRKEKLRIRIHMIEKMLNDGKNQSGGAEGVKQGGGMERKEGIA